VVRFAVEMLAELPSIVVGIFIWAIVVRNITGYSGIAGSLALAVIMIPIIARSVGRDSKTGTEQPAGRGFSPGDPSLEGGCIYCDPYSVAGTLNQYFALRSPCSR